MEITPRKPRVNQAMLKNIRETSKAKTIDIKKIEGSIINSELIK